MVVRSQAEQRTRIPERLLPPPIEHTYDSSTGGRMTEGRQSQMLLAGKENPDERRRTQTGVSAQRSPARVVRVTGRLIMRSVIGRVGSSSMARDQAGRLAIAPAVMER
jgi:hypothetical protein